MLTIKTATQNDLNWINNCYDKVNFVHSDLGNETIAIACYDSVPAGIGRLVTIDGNATELGGIYVFESFRGKGIAGEIVKYLLKFPTHFKDIYLLPFEPLANFYRQFGFTECLIDNSIPLKIKNKHSWCNQHYPQATLLFRLVRD